MNYEAFEDSYYNVQIARIIASVKKLRDEAIPVGRVVPDTDDIVIGTGRRLKMAVMFIDISGFSGRPSEDEKEQQLILDALAIFFTEMIRIAGDYGGTVEKNTGDGLMAYFEDGGGTPKELGTKRAVSCALTMIHITERIINPFLNHLNLEPISFRVAIDYGWVTISRLGAAKRFNAIVAIGTTANVSSKMLSFAEPGEILIGERVRNELPPLWQTLWTVRLNTQTGWIYRESSAMYPFYKYTGRW